MHVECMGPCDVEASVDPLIHVGPNTAPESQSKKTMHGENACTEDVDTNMFINSTGGTRLCRVHENVPRTVSSDARVASGETVTKKSNAMDQVWAVQVCQNAPTYVSSFNLVLGSFGACDTKGLVVWTVHEPRAFAAGLDAGRVTRYAKKGRRALTQRVLR